MPSQFSVRESVVSPLLLVGSALYFALPVFALENVLALNGAPFAASDPAFLLVAGGVNAVAGIPFGLLLPVLKAGDMARHWGVPRQTYLLSRPALRAICSFASGGAISTIVTVPLVERIFWPLAVAPCVVAVCLVLATRRRFRRHRCTEWIMPPPGYGLMRPLIRATRADE